MFLVIINQILKMLIILCIGYLCYRLKMVDEHGNKTLANLLLMVVNPMVAITSLQIDYSPELVHGLLMAYVFSFGIHLVGAVLTTVFIPKDIDNSAIERFCIMYSNCGFIGIPLVQSVIGSEGVFFLTAYMTTFNIFSWTHGVVIMTGSTSGKTLRKGLFSPMIIASFVGLILFVGKIRLPVILGDSLQYVANMNTPLAMLVAGVSVAQTDVGQLLRNKRLYLVSVGKLLIMPALVLAVLCFVHVDSVIAYTLLIASACPVAATGTTFAIRFRKDAQYASGLYAFTTIASLVTIPILVLAAEKLIG